MFRTCLSLRSVSVGGHFVKVIFERWSSLGVHLQLATCDRKQSTPSFGSCFLRENGHWGQMLQTSQAGAAASTAEVTKAQLLQPALDLYEYGQSEALLRTLSSHLRTLLVGDVVVAGGWVIQALRSVCLWSYQKKEWACFFFSLATDLKGAACVVKRAFLAKAQPAAAQKAEAALKSLWALHFSWRCRIWLRW